VEVGDDTEGVVAVADTTLGDNGVADGLVFTAVVEWEVQATSVPATSSNTT
jgi:hypothetical protein